MSSAAAPEVGQVTFSGPIPGFMVAFDLRDKRRWQWEGTDIAFSARADAEACLAERLRTWPEMPFRVYALVALPDHREGLTVTAMRAAVDAVPVDGGDSC